MGRSDGQETHEWPKVPVWGYTVESYLVELSNVPPLKEVVVDCRGVEVVHEEVGKDKLASKSRILDFLEEGVVEPRNVGT